MQEIDTFDVKMRVIPNGLEKYIAFTINNNLAFIDSMLFMNFRLDTLVKNLSEIYFKYSSQEFSGDLLGLLKQKGVYPYKYIDRFKKFFEDKLPDRCKCYSSLKDKLISEIGYLHAINLWNVFKMNTVVDYHDLYLKADVLLLADAFKKFINTSLEYYGLDPLSLI